MVAANRGTSIAGALVWQLITVLGATDIQRTDNVAANDELGSDGKSQDVLHLYREHLQTGNCTANKLIIGQRSLEDLDWGMT